MRTCYRNIIANSNPGRLRPSTLHCGHVYALHSMGCLRFTFYCRIFSKYELQSIRDQLRELKGVYNVSHYATVTTAYPGDTNPGLSVGLMSARHSANAGPGRLVSAS